MVSLCLSTLLTGCSTTEVCEPVIQYETVTVYQDRYVELPTGLTDPVALPPRPEVVDTLALGAYAKQCRVRVRQANGQLKELGELR